MVGVLRACGAMCWSLSGRFVLSVVAFVLGVVLSVPIKTAHAADSDDAAVTTVDPSLSPEELAIVLKPLPKHALEVELEAWFAAVQRSATELATSELIAKRRSEARAQGGDAPYPDKDAHVQGVAELHAAQTKVIDRFKVVLKAYEEKGGDAAEYKQYLAAITGVSVSAKDAEGSWTVVTAWLKSPEGGRRWLWNLSLFAVTLLAFAALAFVAGAVARVGTRVIRSWSTLLRDFVVAMTRRTILFIGVLVALSTLELDMTPILALLGAAGFVIGFALQGTLGNLASGLMILAYRPFDVGDSVTTCDVTGKVASMNLFSTTITTFDNEVMIIPNGSVWNGVITNITGSDKRRVDLVFGTSYADDHAKIVEVLTAVVVEHKLVLEDPEPVVKLHELADSSMNFVVRPWVATDDYWTVYWDITRAVKEAFDREGISIPFPQRDVHLVGSSVAPAGDLGP